MPSLNRILSQSYAQAYRVNRTIRAKQRRPATQPRPSGVLGAPEQPQGTAASLFATQGSNDAINFGQGGASAFSQPDRASQSFDQPSQSNPFRLQTSVSFPPFQGNTSTAFKPTFPTPPSSDFAFTPPPSSDFAFTPPPVNNPFSLPTQNMNQSSGYQGSIFNIPPSTPFGTASASFTGDTGASPAAAQPVFNWGGSFGASEAQPKPQSSPFNAASPAPKLGQQSVFNFTQPSSQSQQLPSKPFEQTTSSLFGAKPIFNQIPTQIEPQSESPSIIPDAQEEQYKTNMFFPLPTLSASQIQAPETSPRKDDDRMSTTPDSSPQAKAPTTSRPFEFLNHSPEGPKKDDANSPEVPRGLFSRLSQPVNSSETPNRAGQDSSSLSESHFRFQDPASTFTLKSPSDLAGSSQSSTSAKNGTEQSSPTKLKVHKATPDLSMPSSEGSGAATRGLFWQPSLPPTLPVAQGSVNSALSVSVELSTRQTSHEGNIASTATESFLLTSAHLSSDQLALESIFKDPMWGKTPVAPEGFTDAQREQLAIGYQLRCADVGLQQHILKSSSFHLESESVTKFYLDLKRRILNGEGLTNQRVTAKKRKASHDEISNDSYSKRTKMDTDPQPVRAHNQITNGGWLNSPNRPKSLLTEPALLPQVTISRSQADETPAIENVERLPETAKQVPSEGTISYPSLSTSMGSVTSNLFKNILQNKDHESEPTMGKGELDGDKQMIASLEARVVPNHNDTSIRSDSPSLFTKTADSPSVSIPPAEPMYPSLEQSARSDPIINTSSAKNTSSFNFNQPVSQSKPISPMPQKAASSNPFASLSGAKETPSISVTQASSFTPPQFGSTQPVNFFSQFGKIAEENKQKEKESRKADDFDSDEDDDAEWERKDAEWQRAKKQKLDETLKSKIAKFVPGKGFTISDQRTEDHAPGTPQEVGSKSSLNGTASLDNTRSVLSNKTPSLGNGHNIFGHLSDVESGAEGSKVGDADDEETGSDDAIDDDGVREATKTTVSDDSRYGERIPGIGQPSEPLAGRNPFGSASAFAVSKSTNLLPETTEKSQNVGRSIFDRISKDKDGKAIREITPPTEKRSDTPVGASLPSLNNIFNQGNSGARSNIFGLPTSEAGANIFGQRMTEAKANIFTPKTSNTISNDWEQRDSDTEPDSSKQNTSTDKEVITAEDPTSETRANIVEQANSLIQPNAVEHLNSEIAAKADMEKNLEAAGDHDEKRNSDPTDKDEEKRNSEARANFSEKPEIETRDSTGGQAPSSTSGKADVARATYPDIFSSNPTTSMGSSTPTSSMNSSKPLFAFTRSPGGDNTWKVNSPIKFGNSSSGPPGLTVTSPTPSKPSLGGLFGSSPANLAPETSVKPPASIFNFNAGKAPAVSGFGFNFGGPPTATSGSLAAPPMASNATSRATSPGITTGDNSAAESNAEGAEDGSEHHEQLNLADKGPGEEDEDVLFAVKAKAMTFDSSTTAWVTRGLGQLRVLKHRDTAKTRILLKQDPGGKIILNAALLSTMKYEHTQPKSVKLGVATDVGKLVTWIIRTGKDEDAMELARILEANKSN